MALYTYRPEQGGTYLVELTDEQAKVMVVPGGMYTPADAQATEMTPAETLAAESAELVPPEPITSEESSTLT